MEHDLDRYNESPGIDPERKFIAIKEQDNVLSIIDDILNTIDSILEKMDKSKYTDIVDTVENLRIYIRKFKYLVNKGTELMENHNILIKKLKDFTLSNDQRNIFIKTSLQIKTRILYIAENITLHRNIIKMILQSLSYKVISHKIKADGDKLKYSEDLYRIIYFSYYFLSEYTDKSNFLVKLERIFITQKEFTKFCRKIFSSFFNSKASAGALSVRKKMYMPDQFSNNFEKNIVFNVDPQIEFNYFHLFDLSESYNDCILRQGVYGDVLGENNNLNFQLRLISLIHGSDPKRHFISEKFSGVSRIIPSRVLEKSFNSGICLAKTKGTVKVDFMLNGEITSRNFQFNFYSYVNRTHLESYIKNGISFPYSYRIELTDSVNSGLIGIYNTDAFDIERFNGGSEINNKGYSIPSHHLESSLSQILIGHVKKGFEKKYLNNINSSFSLFDLNKNTLFGKKLADIIDGFIKGEIDSSYLYEGIGRSYYSKIPDSEGYREATVSELCLFGENADSIRRFIGSYFIDIGSGDGKKAKSTIEALGVGKIKYIAFDMDVKTQRQAYGNLRNFYKKLDKENEAGVSSLVGSETKFEELKNIEQKTMFLLGFTLGNFDTRGQMGFLSNIKDKMNSGESLILSVFMEQDEETIRRLYENKEGMAFVFAFFRGLGIKDKDMKYIVEYGEDKIARIGVEFINNIEFKIGNSFISKKKGEKIYVSRSQRFTMNYLEKLFEETGFNLKKSLIKDGYGLFILRKE